MRSRLLYDQREKIYAVVFSSGEECVSGLTAFAAEQSLDASQITAIGGFSDTTLGYFDFDRRDYDEIPVPEQVEVLSLLGDISYTDDGPKIHVHVVLGKPDGSTVGGHLLRAIVRPTLEVIVTESPEHLRRRIDPETGAALLDMDE